MKKIVLLLAACMLAEGEMNAQKLSGREIIQKVKDRPDGNTRYAEMELTLRKKNGTTRQRKVNSWALDEDSLQIGVKGFVDTYHALRTDEPNDWMSSRTRVRGEVILLHCSS